MADGVDDEYEYVVCEGVDDPGLIAAMNEFNDLVVDLGCRYGVSASDDCLSGTIRWITPDGREYDLLQILRFAAGKDGVA